MSSKLIRDGKVAVLYSPGWGAGWSTWNAQYPELVFDSVIVDFVLNKSENWYEGILSYCSMVYPDAYTGGVDTLEVEWLPVGTHFLIEEFDGNESIQVRDSTNWMVA
jgi:hypothetical protein